MLVKTVINRIGDFKPWVVKKVELEGKGILSILLVTLEPRANSRGRCSVCKRKCSTHQTKRVRPWEYIPLWGITTLVFYARRRVDCPIHGVVVEWLPWAEGKSRLTTMYRWYLARWAKRLSIQEVAEVFRTSWKKVFKAVEWAVEWGLKHRDVEGVKAIGVDELQCGKGQDYLTLVYQIEQTCRRLLWVGKDRCEDTLRSFFKEFGEEWTSGLEFVCSDMLQAYLNVIAEMAKNAKNVLDRYHLAAKMNEAIDDVRRQEVKSLEEQGKEPVLKKKRWIVLKRPENLTEKQDAKLSDLLQYNLKTVRSYLLKEEFDHFWDYVSPYWAGQFMERWCKKVMRSRIEPMKKIARSLREHRPLILNWFKARQAAVSLGAVEGFNNKAGVIKRRSYGFRTDRVYTIMLYHGLGELPEPEVTHCFCC